MAIIRQNFTDNNTITIALASLANGASATSSAIDNSTNKFTSAIIQIQITTTAVVDEVSGRYGIFLLKSIDGGVTYDDANNNMQPITFLNICVNNFVFRSSVDTSALGALPSFWKILITNNSGAALDATAGNHYVKFTGKKYETV